MNSQPISACLYKLDFPNGKSYIGITKHSAEKRFAKHVESSNFGKRKYAVQCAIKKYGENSVRVSTLAIAAWEYVIDLEQRAIRAYNAKVPHGYNMTDGGEGAKGLSPSSREKLSNALKSKWKSSPDRRARQIERNKNIILSDEAREKMSAAKKGRKLSMDVRAKMSEAQKISKRDPVLRAQVAAKLKGIIRSPETCVKIGAAHKGMKHSAEAIAKISAANKGKKMSAELLLKLITINTGRPRSAEIRAKISAGRKGKKLTDEHRAKLSVAAKERCGRQKPKDRKL